MTVFGVSIEKNGRIIRRSKNLRGIIDYARTSPASRVELTPQGVTRGRVRVIYADGAVTSAQFNSYRIAVDWVRRRRIFGAASVIYYGPDFGYFTKPGLIAGAE